MGASSKYDVVAVFSVSDMVCFPSVGPTPKRTCTPKRNPMTPVVFLLHGIGGHAWSLRPLCLALQAAGFARAHCLTYPVDEHDHLETLVDFVDAAMREHAAPDELVVLIGQSMGGVVANRMHRRGWRVQKAIYIGSPLRGAHLLRQLDAVLPRWVRKKLYKKPYGILLNKPEEQPPPHPYHTFSMGWFRTTFDGCVYQGEATLEPAHHTHLCFADHRIVFANPRLWVAVKRQLLPM